MTNNRFIFLDGIRGLAAVFVLTRHTGSFWDYDFFHSYLGVDLFFILSGYVISYAYDYRLKTKKLTPFSFMLIRFIRLYPIYFLSLIISCTSLIVSIDNYNENLFTEISSLFFFTTLFIPTRPDGAVQLFYINGTYWSLFYELIANFIFALIRPILNDILLSIIVITSGISLFFLSYFHGSLDAGFFYSKLSVLAGVTRSIFGIFFGIFLFRHNNYFCNKFEKVSPWISFILVGIILSLPQINNYDWIIDITVVFIVFPICVVIASKNNYTKFESILLMLGSASYPMYVLHKPFFELVSYLINGIEKSYTPYSGILLTIILIIFSVIIEKNYDIPVRKKITQYFFKKIR